METDLDLVALEQYYKFADNRIFRLIQRLREAEAEVEEHKQLQREVERLTQALDNAVIFNMSKNRIIERLEDKLTELRLIKGKDV